MTDILLIQPPIRDFYLTAKRTIPYGLACIAPVLLENGFSVDIFDGLATSKSRIIDYPETFTYLEKYYGQSDVSPFALFHQYRRYGYSFEHIGKKAKESGAFLVGISSLFTPYSDEALEVAETVKKFHPDCKIVIGGHHPTALPESVMSCNAVDYVLRGEGEVSMSVLANALKKNQPLSHVPGIVFRKPDGRLHISKPGFMDHPDDWPLPAKQLVKQRFYQREKADSTIIVTSRGCPMKCSYCSLGSSTINYRRRSVESVIREIDQAVRNDNVRFIDFEDENLTLEKSWILELLTGITSRYTQFNIELRAMNGLFPPSLNNEIISAMKQAGFRTLNLSLGSTSGKQLRQFNRPDVRQSLENALDLACTYDLESVCYIIVGAPGQSAEDAVSDLVYLAGKNTIAGVSVFYPAPDSADYDVCKNLGILPEHFSLMRSSAIPLSHLTTRRDSITLLRMGRIINFMKSLLDNGDIIPEPIPCHEDILTDTRDRIETGKKLLAWFLYDGTIRGTTREGQIYCHHISEKLTKLFINSRPVITSLNGKRSQKLSQ